MRYLFGFLCVCTLGLIPLVGCGEGTGGAGGTSAGACTNQDDLAIVCAQEFVDWTWQCGASAVTGCGFAPEDDVAGMLECHATTTSQCLQQDNSMSRGCGDCFGDTVACVLENCESCTFGPYTQECFMCRAENCNDEMYECTGDIVTGCNGDVWCQHVDCDDLVDCTEDVCDPADGVCGNQAVADGAPCAGGTCELGACALTGSVLPCTEQGIRNAVAAGDGPYTFDCTGPTTVVTKAEIVMRKDVILDGGGNLMVDGDDNHRVFSIAEGVTVELIGFGVTRGVATEASDGAGGTGGTGGSDGTGGTDGTDGTGGTGGTGGMGGTEESFEGGGIANHGTLIITNSTVSENGGGEDSYGVRGGGVFNDGTLTLSNTTVSLNFGALGGGIWNDGLLTMTNSTVSENTAEEGGGIFNNGTLVITVAEVWGNRAHQIGGGFRNEGMLTLANTKVSENSAGEDGGGIDNDGTLTLMESTVSGNNADLAGGILNGGTLVLMASTISWNQALVIGGIGNDQDGTVTTTNSTVSRNHAEYFAGSIYNDGTMRLISSTVSGDDTRLAGVILNTGTLTVTSSLVDGNCDGALNSNGYNIESPGNTCGFREASDQASVSVEDLKLEPLADNDGPTETHALGLGSDAINWIPEAACQVDEDQRGQPRPVGDGCDVGSFEVQSDDSM